MEEFSYVVERKKPDKVCFLSTKERGYYKKIKKETRSIGPYNLERTSALYQILNKVRSKRGVGGLADTAPRFGKIIIDDVPGPALGIIEPKKPKENKFPFGSMLPRLTYKFSSVPGPGNYDTSSVCKTTKMCQTFGGPRKMKPAIDTLCIARPMARCILCGDICDGDYWHKDESIFMCSVCITIERFYHKKCTKEELKKYKRIRNCSFLHQHEGTTAALRLLPKKLVVMKARKENYLDLFLKAY